MLSKVNSLTERFDSLKLDKATRPKTSIDNEENKHKPREAIIVDIGRPSVSCSIYNKKGYLGSDPRPDLTYPKKNTLKQEGFYDKTRNCLVEARKTPEKAKSIVQALIKYPKKLIKDIRTYSLKEQGEKRGSGEDELFMTSETSTLVERSAGIIKDKHAISYHYNCIGEIVEFDWMDAQKDVRNPTKYQIYNNGQGHSGALYKFPSPSRKGAMTVGQADFHRIRHEEILKSGTPRNAIIRAVRSDLKLTPNAEKFNEVVNEGFDCKDRDMNKPNEKAEAKIEYLIDRNRRKKVHEYFLNETFNDDGASEVSDYAVSSEDDI